MSTDETPKSQDLDAGTIQSEAKPSSAPSRKKQRPLKPLPTERVSFQKQVDALNAYASIYDTTRGPVSNDAVGKIIKLHPTTTGLTNSFFVEMGLLQRTEGGFLPSEEVKAYALARQWEEEFPGHKLRTLLSEGWFSQALLPHLRAGAKEEREVLAILATTAAAEPAYRPNLLTILEYMEYAGIIEREGTLVRVSRPAKEAPTPSPPPPPPGKENAPAAEGPPATSRTVNLESGGKLTVSVTLDPFALSPTDRAFVFKLIDDLLGYEAGRKKEEREE